MFVQAVFRKSLLKSLAGLFFASVAAASSSPLANFDGASWTDGPIIIEVDTSGTAALQPGEGSILFSALVSAAADWNSALGIRLLRLVPSSAPGADADRELGDSINGIYFSRQISPSQRFGSQFGFAASHRAPNGRFGEADLIFNPAHHWYVYDGPLKYDTDGDRVADLRRVALHEFGHLLGISHPNDDAFPTIMRSRMSDLFSLTPRDCKDARLAAKLLADRNRPTVDRYKIKACGNGTFRIVLLKGSSNKLFTKALWVETRGSSGREKTRIRPSRHWRKTLRIGPDVTRLTVVHQPTAFRKKHLILFRKRIRQ
ncbi:MAG: matrixin family metalloprotease [Chthoniobacterales bacterium]